MSDLPAGFPARFPVRRDDRRPWRYRIAVFLCRVYLRLLSRRRVRVIGAENMPADGPLLLVSNHVSNLDPMVIGGYCPLTLFAMAKREMYFNRVASWFFAGCNSIPVDRGHADRRAVTMALAVLRDGGRLLMFVEGTRSRDGAMQRAEAGIGFLARRSGAPILPAAITGTDGRGLDASGSENRHEAVLRYGPVLRPDLGGRRDDAVIADEIAAHIAALLPPDRRGVYATPTESSHSTSPAPHRIPSAAD